MLLDADEKEGSAEPRIFAEILPLESGEIQPAGEVSILCLFQYHNHVDTYYKFRVIAEALLGDLKNDFTGINSTYLSIYDLYAYIMESVDCLYLWCMRNVIHVQCSPQSELKA